MTQDEIIDKDEVLKMARQAAAVNGTIISVGFDGEFLEAFAKLVAAKEREACAKAFDELAEKATSVKDLMYLNMTAAAIRALGEPTSRGEA
jgi:phosphopantetheinyl transferase (holo-ACP synthase)